MKRSFKNIKEGYHVAKAIKEDQIKGFACPLFPSTSSWWDYFFLNFYYNKFYGGTRDFRTRISCQLQGIDC